MVHIPVKHEHLWGNPDPHRTWTEREARFLAAAYDRCPVLTLAGSMFVMGAGLLLAVSLTTLLITLPLGFLLGWY
jgi:hypothetical protein